MRWDKVAVPFKVAVNVNEVVEQNMRKHLRGLAQYTWDGWNDAADYLVNAKADLEEALPTPDKSIAVEERYENLMTKSQVLDLLERKEEAAKFRTEALARANATESYTYARQLQRAKKV